MNVSAGAPPAPPGPRDRRAATRGDPPAGLKDPEDIFLTTWNVAIMGPLSTVYENRLYSCELARPGALRARGAARRRFRRAQVCGPRYPSVPPEVKFHAENFDVVHSLLHPLGIHVRVIGGGRIARQESNKTISVYGYSKTFGRSPGCNERTAGIIREVLPGYEVTWSDAGY